MRYDDARGRRSFTFCVHFVWGFIEYAYVLIYTRRGLCCATVIESNSKSCMGEIQVAAQTLVVGGKLCYLLASTWDFDLARDLPRHPCLQLSHHSVQGLTQQLCRRLITMTKVRHVTGAS